MVRNSETLNQIKSKFEAFSPYLNEKTRRLWAAVETMGLGRGGISQVAQATGLSRTTIYAGLQELEARGENPSSCSTLRKEGGGRKSLVETDVNLVEDLQSLLAENTRGDPQSALQWTCKSTPKLALALQQMGHKVSERSVCRLLHELGYSLQSNLKTQEGKQHPDRDKQFLHITKVAEEMHRQGEPVISVDAKKKELIGNFKNSGKEWRPHGEPTPVKVHDFPDEMLGKALPYGVYDVTMDQGWVSVGISHDTAEFAVESIRRWWYEMGQPLYPNAGSLMVTADCGGSNSYRSRLWKLTLQELADETRLTIKVCHFPPGTSKWNKVEHRLFCHITQNWRGRPLTSRGVIVKLIGQTKTEKGLRVKAKLDKHKYKTKIKVSDEDFEAIALEKDKFHGEWNYQIQPRERI